MVNDFTSPCTNDRNALYTTQVEGEVQQEGSAIFFWKQERRHCIVSIYLGTIISYPVSVQINQTSRFVFWRGNPASSQSDALGGF